MKYKLPKIIDILSKYHFPGHKPLITEELKCMLLRRITLFVEDSEERKRKKSPASKVRNNWEKRENMFHACFFPEKLNKQEKRNNVKDEVIYLYLSKSIYHNVWSYLREFHLVLT